MMGFITGISHDTCEICKAKFLSAATNKSSPYNDYSCTKCNWTGKICYSCGSKACIKCGSKIQSTYEKHKEHIIHY